MSDLQTFPIAVYGGINQSVAEPTPQDFENLENFAIFRGRLGLRAPITLVATFEDDQGTPADVTAVLDVVEFQNKLWAATYSSNTNKVYLHSVETDGTSVTLEDVVWTTVSTKPVVKLVSFTGGVAETSVDRLYISDYDQDEITRYYDSDSDSMVDVKCDFNADDTAEDVKFSLIESFKFHLWGTGFYEGTATRLEMLRFSQPGLVPGTDPAGGAFDPDISGGSGSEKQWFAADHRSVGKRGSKIRSLSTAGDRLIVFQQRAAHAIFGSGSNTWTRQQISEVIGCVGPHASTSVDERVCYFWASDGPYMTDGNQLQYIGDPIRQLVVTVDAAEDDAQVAYSPDDGLVHFILSSSGADSYSLDLAFDHRQQRWMKITWLVGSSAELELSGFAVASLGSAEGTQGDPTSLSATATSDTTIDLTWTNGDVNINTDTHIYRDTSTGFTPDDGTNRIATVEAGVNTYEGTGLTQDTEYFYIVRHFRSGSHSSDSNEDSDTTWLAEPDNMAATGTTNGVDVTGDNNASGADIEIYRSTSAGSGFTLLTTLTTPGATFDHSDTSGDCGTTYYYYTVAVKAGSTDSENSTTVNAEACATGGSGVPDAPSDLIAGDDGTNANLTWTLNSNNEDEVQVWRSETDNTSYGALPFQSLPAGTTTYDDGEVDLENEVYYYKIRACNPDGCSGFSNEEQVPGI